MHPLPLVALLLAGNPSGPVVGLPTPQERRCRRPGAEASKAVWDVVFERITARDLVSQLGPMTGMTWTLAPDVTPQTLFSLSNAEGKKASLSPNALVDAVLQGARAAGLQLVESPKGCQLARLPDAPAVKAVTVKVAQDGAVTVTPE